MGESEVEVSVPPKRLRAAALLLLLLLLHVLLLNNGLHCGFVATAKKLGRPDDPIISAKHGSTQVVLAEKVLGLFPPRRTRSDTARRLEVKLKTEEVRQAVEHMTL